MAGYIEKGFWEGMDGRKEGMVWDLFVSGVSLSRFGFLFHSSSGVVDCVFGGGRNWKIWAMNDDCTIPMLRREASNTCIIRNI